jgi:hypothetical protein
MKTTNLEYTNIPVLLPPIDFFLEKIKSNTPFHFIRINHGIIDLIHLAFPNLDEFENLFVNNEFDLIAEKMVNASKQDVNTPLETYHRNTTKSLLVNKTSIFLQVLKNYKKISPKIDISVSLGVGLHTYWGTWGHTHPYQIGRTKVWSIIKKYESNSFYYSGVLKHYTITGEIFQLFEQLNENNFGVIFVGRDYLKLYETIFKVQKFHHIKIPNSGAINHIDDYISDIKNISTNYQNTIVIHSTGHILSSYIAHELEGTNIFGLDIGRSFDLLVKSKINEHSDIPRCWVTQLDENGLKNYVTNLRNQSI